MKTSMRRIMITVLTGPTIIVDSLDSSVDGEDEYVVLMKHLWDVSLILQIQGQDL